MVGLLIAIRIEEKGEGFENGKSCFGISDSAFDLTYPPITNKKQDSPKTILSIMNLEYRLKIKVKTSLNLSLKRLLKWLSQAHQVA